MDPRTGSIATTGDGRYWCGLSRLRRSARPLPPIGQMDTFLRALLGGLSSSPELARWLATDDLIQQMANGIERVSTGQSAARDVPVLKPGGTFGTSGSSQRATIDSASFRR